MKTDDLLAAVGLAIIFAALFATLFDLAPVIAKAMVRQAARWWKSDLDTPEELAEEWERLVEERPVGILKIGTGLRFWVQGAIRLSLFAAEKQTARASLLLMKLAEIPAQFLLKITESAGLVTSSLRTLVALITDYLSAERPEPSHRPLGRPFRWYFAASTVSNIGTWLQNTCQVLLAYQLTHTVLAVGAVVCAQFIWVLLLGPWAGRLVSRTQSVRRLMICTQVASAAVAGAMAVLQFHHLLTGQPLIAGVLGLGLAYCLTLPATAVLVPALISERQSDLETKREIRAALSLDSASYNIGRCVGPALAILFITRIGFGWAFALNAASFLVLAAALTRARLQTTPRPNHQAKISDGFRLISRNPKVGPLLIIMAAVAISADPILVLGPALAHHFHLPEAWAGYFLSALGGGTILASFLPIRPPSKMRHATYPLFLLGAAVTVFGLGINPWWSLVAAGVAGVACLLTGSAARALLWAFVPLDQEPQRPAIMAIWAVAWAGSTSLASLADSILATFIGVWTTGALSWDVPGVQAACVLLALPALIPALISTVLMPARHRHLS